MDSPYSFAKRLSLILLLIIIIVLVTRFIVLPDSWGEHGYYRANYINEEANKSLIYGTNDSCKSCHEEIYDMKKQSTHERLSCEVCHAPVSEHVKNGQKFKDMLVSKHENQTELCLKCHQNVQGRPEKFPMIDFPKHLEEQNVKTTHDCNQCHTVHDPLESMNYIRKLRTLREEVSK